MTKRYTVLLAASAVSLAVVLILPSFTARAIVTCLLLLSAAVLLGRAFLAFSHDVSSGNEADWTEWHDREHIPERLAVPGFLRLRRYVALAGGPRFFYFYETESLAVLQSPAYLERLGNPTPWTKRCMPYVVNNTRTACRLSATLGHGLGGALAVVDIGPAASRADALRRWLIETALPAALSRTGIVGVHMGEADAAATTVKTDEKKLLQTPDAMARWIAMVEGVDRDSAAAAASEALGDGALRAAGAEGEIPRRLYQLSFVMGG